MSHSRAARTRAIAEIQITAGGKVAFMAEPLVELAAITVDCGDVAAMAEFIGAHLTLR
jgi:hypothetical protein